jgi:hypothetical protein
LAQDSAAGRTTAAYLREHAGDLASAATASTGVLEDASTEPPLEPRLRQLRSLAGRLSTDLARLETASAQQSLALARLLQAEARTGEQIAAGLS